MPFSVGWGPKLSLTPFKLRRVLCSSTMPLSQVDISNVLLILLSSKSKCHTSPDGSSLPVVPHLALRPLSRRCILYVSWIPLSARCESCLLLVPFLTRHGLHISQILLYDKYGPYLPQVHLGVAFTVLLTKSPVIQVWFIPLSDAPLSDVIHTSHKTPSQSVVDYAWH